MHNEYFYNRSPNDGSTTSTRSIWGSDLGDLERNPGCEPIRRLASRPAPSPLLHTGGFGRIFRTVGFRWRGETQSSHMFEAEAATRSNMAGALELTPVLGSDRVLLGPAGTRGDGFVNVYPDGSFDSVNFFTPTAARTPQFGDVAFHRRQALHQLPLSGLLEPGAVADGYQDNLKARSRASPTLYFSGQLQPLGAART